MPQEFQVVRCYKCLMFQVEIVKKIPKWRCCICNEKQSVKKIFEKGLSKDCRLFVQENNKRLITITEKASEIQISPPDIDNAAPSESVTCPDIQNESKWIDFDDKTSHIADQEGPSSYTFKSPPKKKFKKMKEKNLKVAVNCESLENDSAKELDEDELRNPENFKTKKWLFYCSDNDNVSDNNKVSTNNFLSISSPSSTKYENNALLISNTRSVRGLHKKDLLGCNKKPELKKFEDNELNLDSVLSYD